MGATQQQQDASRQLVQSMADFELEQSSGEQSQSAQRMIGRDRECFSGSDLSVIFALCL